MVPADTVAMQEPCYNSHTVAWRERAEAMDLPEKVAPITSKSSGRHGDDSWWSFLTEKQSVLVAIPEIVVTTHEAVIICRESMLLAVAITGREAKLWSHDGYY